MTVLPASGCLQHLYGGDVMWFTHTRGDPAIPLAEIPVPKSFPELDAQWQKLLNEMVDWAKSCTADQWQSPVTLLSKRQLRMWQAVMHLSNHDTYHRGQLTTLIRQVGGTPVNSDVLFFYLDHFPG